MASPQAETAVRATIAGTPAPRRRDAWRTGAKRFFWGALVLFAGCSFLLGFLLHSPGVPDWLEVALLGAIPAQGGLHAIGCVLAPVRRTRRIVLAVGTALVWFAAWAAGWVLRHSSYYLVSLSTWEDIFTGLLCLPLLLLAVQLPLWVARCFFRWRVFHRHDPARRLPCEPLGIRHILIATGVVAAALSAARMGLAVSGTSDSGALIRLVLNALVAAGVSLLITLPVVVATLRARRLWLSLPAILVLDLATMVGFAVAFSMIQGSWPRPQEYPRLALWAISLYVWLVGSMLIVRRLGFRLYRSPHAPREGGYTGAAAESEDRL